ncbi:ATP-dependent HslUV protease ATP-binding subunit HslU [Caloramator fervidus]|uniref:ATP-dependent protease ATPase subunit HslU n=1 Tax=Caloramator fervidus TaxID=29344 RepID=A0A1H5XBX9_9CLOT|nr:ATP-dependent protease ATPase subunit HslU [Caloramator fervidus]SEG09258.1 ATP-dependent HslUV protease ATP-binding subunit HslU [Caloramator fervidus]
MNNLTPKEIVKELDKYIVGQDEAKKKVAIALRNRYRRKALIGEIKDDIMPKNILMIGPTGVGKTEIARRLAKLVKAPFVKVEATKFTEVGYVGRDVDSIIRDLMEDAIRLVKEEKMNEVREKAAEMAKERVLNILAPIPSKKNNNVKNPFDIIFGFQQDNNQEVIQYDESELQLKREQILKQLNDGLLDDMIIEIEIEDSSIMPIEIMAGPNIEGLNINFSDILGDIFPKKKKKKKVKIKEALRIFEQEEASKLIDMDLVYEEARKRAEEDGIVFIDEIDKIASRSKGYGPDVSREGVQRDILPIVEGSVVNTKYGPVKTDHILFIAAGAFYVSKVTDLIPELQGRFPVRVELKALNKDDFKAILLKPKNALTKQYIELLKVDGVEIEFTEDGIDEIAEVAYFMNMQLENIGARRLHTVLEEVLKDISFEAPDIPNKKVIINREYVKDKLKNIYKQDDTTKFII